MTAIAVSRLHFPVTTLGPGRRVGVWVQGCSLRCPGCVSADTWPAGRGMTTVEAVVQAVEPWLREADGITVSGGEPFEQPVALLALLRELRARTPADVLVYSGHPVEAIAPWLARAKGLIDALISDPYVEEAPQTLPLRGSDNQRLHLLTDLGRSRFAEHQRPAAAPERRFDVMFDADGQVFLAGIPPRGDLARLRAALAAAGHAAWTSQAPGRPA
jgi:anaerobic ribonucleoside-triphosphate reductase activating protein